MSNPTVADNSRPDDPSVSRRLHESDFVALDRSVRLGIVWTGTAKWAVQLAVWVSTIIVLRTLTPVDYGIVAMALVFVALLQPISDFGIASAIVQDRTLSDKHIARLGGFALLIGGACAIVTALAAIPIAQFFQEPALRVVIPVVGLGFVIGAFRIVPSALLARDMRFGHLAVLEAVEGLTAMAVTLTLAMLGAGFWSLVLGTIASRVVGSIMATALRPTAIALTPHLGDIAHSLRFGAWVTTSTFAWYAYCNADRVLIGRAIGEAALGAYTIAATFAALPIEKITPLYARVFESVIAHVQSHRGAIARYFLNITEGVAMLSFPLGVGLALVADQFVMALLGERWEAAILPMQLLALGAVTRALDPPLAHVLVASGHARENARSMMIAAAVLPVAFVAAVYFGWGVAGIATVWLVGHPAVVMTRQVWLVLRVAESSVAAYLRALWPATSATLVMAFAVLCVRIALPPLQPALGLMAGIATGAFAYVAALWLLHRARVRMAVAFVRGR